MIGTSNFCAKHALATSIKSLYSNAKVRKLTVTLTIREIGEMLLLECYYCAKPADPVNGIDRLDSSVGYSTENCCTACKECNRVKGKCPIDEFLESCARRSQRWWAMTGNFIRTEDCVAWEQ